MTLSCGHVIPKENLLAWPVASGPTGQEFEFTFEKRSSPRMVRGNCGPSPHLLAKEERKGTPHFYSILLFWLAPGSFLFSSYG